MILRGGTARTTGVNAALPPEAENLDGDRDTEPLPVDARGLTRVVSGIVDIGAVELQDGVAQDDAFAISESGTIVGQDVHNNNGNGPDTGDQLTVPEVNGQANGGAPFAFASGATFTVGADGTFNFNPGDAYDHLPGVGSGASNITANETFTYTLPGGDTATVTIAITGLSFNDDTLLGTLANTRSSAAPATLLLRGERRRRHHRRRGRRRRPRLRRGELWAGGGDQHRGDLDRQLARLVRRHQPDR